MNDHKTSLATRLLHGAKDLVWQDEIPVRGNKTDVQAASKTLTIAAVNSDNTTRSVTPGREAPETGMSKELLKLVMERPTAYSALSEAIDALAELPMDEATRYRSAFAVLKKTQQRTVEQVVQAIATHQEVLATEQNRFANQSRAAEDDEINARLAEVKALSTAIAQGKQQMDSLRSEAEQRIRKIQEDLECKQSRAAELEREADMRKKTIEKTIQDFAIAVASVKARLDADQQRVRQHLATVTTVGTAGTT